MDILVDFDIGIQAGNGLYRGVREAEAGVEHRIFAIKETEKIRGQEKGG